MSEHDTAKLEADDATSELVLRLAAITSRAEELRLHLLNLITAEEFSATRQLLDSTHD